ncbi:Thymidylate kinase [Dictyocoela muelleri]|nr:Thymidylate kinase [Dictyocoela muelleri]
MNFIISIEGIDKSGKTTLSKNLLNRLNSSLLVKSKNIPVSRISFPDRSTEIGNLIDKYLKNKVEFNPETIHLLFSANRWENIDRLKNGIVILDRYVYSGIAHSLVLGCDEKWTISSDLGLPEPDISIFIDLKANGALKRSMFGEEKYENVEFMDRTYTFLKRLVLDSKNPLIIDGNLSQEEISELVFEKIIKMIQ